ncbi:hypothetical protein Lfu02_64920 [Longispora fulva]|nr:hypothetical protein Lfu02_64920 [Longispora fulva]
MLAAIAAAVGVGTCAGTTWLPVTARVFVLALVSVPVLFVGIAAHGRVGWALAGWTLVLLCQAGAMLATADGLLAGDRDRVAATVLADVGVDGRGGPHLYALAGPDGVRLDGQLRTGVRHRTGDRVAVLVDPSGWLNPTTPDAAREAGATADFAGLTGVAGLVLALAAVRPPRRPAPTPAGPPATDAELARRLVVEFLRAHVVPEELRDPDDYLAALDPAADQEAFEALMAWVRTSGPVPAGTRDERLARLRAVTDGVSAVFRWRAARF